MENRNHSIKVSEKIFLVILEKAIFCHFQITQHVFLKQTEFSFKSVYISSLLIFLDLSISSR